MAVWKVHHTKDYTIVNNNVLKDPNLSLKTIGLFVKVLSLPPDWNFTEAGLAAICKDGLRVVQGALKELEEFGYLVRTQTKTQAGTFSVSQYDFYEDPIIQIPSTQNAITENASTQNANNKINNNIINNNKLDDKSSNELENFMTTSMHKQIYKAPVKKKDVSENSRAFENLVEFINSLTYNESTKNNLLLWYKNVGVGLVSIKQLKDKIIKLHEAKLTEEQISNIYYTSYINGWKAFFVPTNKSYNNARMVVDSKTPEKVMEDDLARNPDGTLVEIEL